MVMYVFILCVTLLSSSDGLSLKARVNNLERQVGHLVVQTKDDMYEIRGLVESLNDTVNTGCGDNEAPGSNGVKSDEMRAVVVKVESFMDEQSERIAVLQNAFVDEKLKTIEYMNERNAAEDAEMDERVNESIEKLGDRIDLTETKRKMTRVEMMSKIDDLTAMFHELNATLANVQHTWMEPVGNPGIAVKPWQPSGPCPASWVHRGNKCYLVVANETVIWDVASMRCDDPYGGILAEPDTEEAMSNVFALVDDNAWIGATDELPGGTWKWINSKKPVTYFKWDSGQPNNFRGDQHCLEIHNGHHNDENCLTDNKFVCQKNVN